MQFDIAMLRKCWFLAGPTACGKTSASLILSERIGAEIVALDSMSLYQGMDVGTAKADADERRRVPHHLLDVIRPHEEFSLAEYVEAADRTCRGIVDRGRVPLFVGGTGLYLRGVLRGVFEGPAADWNLRRRLETDAEAGQDLHRRLAEVDSASAQRLHPNDLRRIVRALEVFELTGRPASELQQQSPLPEPDRPANVYWLSPPRDWLYRRIDARVEQMLTEGLVDEVTQLLESPRPMSRTARQALGYREIIEHLRGDCTLEDAVTRIQINTRQFAKRQHTWFRNLEECCEIPITGMESPEEIVERILIRAGDQAPQRPS